MSARRFIPERIEGRHVLIALLAFFGVMLAVNGAFTYYAVKTFTGFDTRDAYRTGLRYNERIAAERLQIARGWQPVLRYERDARRLLLEVRDRNGRLVSGLTVTGRIGRPVTDAADRTLQWREIAPAQYAAMLDLAPGQWTVEARIARAGGGAEPAHRLRQRLLVRGE